MRIKDNKCLDEKKLSEFYISEEDMLSYGIIRHKVQPMSCTKQNYEWFCEEQQKSKCFTLRRPRQYRAGCWVHHLHGPGAGQCDFN